MKVQFLLFTSVDNDFLALKRQLAIDIDLASRPKETPKLEEKSRKGSLEKLLRGEELDEKPSPMPRLSFKSEMNMKKIELELNKERFGARYEFEVRNKSLNATLNPPRMR